MRKSVMFTFLFAVIAACSSQKEGLTLDKNTTSQLREPTAAERLNDFSYLKELFKTYYGPYEYKEKRFGFNIDKLITDLGTQAAQSKSDEEFTGYVMQVGAAMKDAHVQIVVENTASGISAYRIPIVITPVEGKAIIAGIPDDLKKFTEFSVGDEVVSIDGQAPMALLPIINKYKAMPNDKSNLHLVFLAFNRPSYMLELVPKSPLAQVVVKTTKGFTKHAGIAWETIKYNEEMTKLLDPRLQMRLPLGDEINQVYSHHIRQMGQVDPIFLNPQTEAAFNFAKVYPSVAARKKFGLEEKETPPIYAALYNYKNKNILLVRQATYSPSDYKTSKYLAAYQALISEFQNVADVMVLDQTHNPGGSYCAEFYNLFANQNDTQAVQYMNADRKWINDMRFNWLEKAPADSISYDNRASEAWSLVIEKAYDAQLRLSEAIPVFTSAFYASPAKAVWHKPMLVLIDELAGSCGDLFPMLVKANGRAKLFGETTMGAGGNVELVGTLSNTRIHVAMTRGLFFPFNPNRPPLDSEFVENNGVSPDYRYNHSVEDFRAGFVGYVKAFSERAIQQITN